LPQPRIREEWLSRLSKNCQALENEREVRRSVERRDAHPAAGSAAP